jgi:hypothetical protein
MFPTTTTTTNNNIKTSGIENITPSVQLFSLFFPGPQNYSLGLFKESNEK